jgi:hypothetical protein
MATVGTTRRGHGLRRLAAAFGVCLVGSIAIVAYGLTNGGAITTDVLLGSLAVCGLIAGLVAPSVGGGVAALAGGWIGLVGYAVVYSIGHADLAEAGLHSAAAALFAVIVPIGAGPGFLVGAVVARGAPATWRRLTSHA